MWVIFLQPFEWSPPERYGRTMLSFRPGPPILVRRLCALAAIAAGAAELAAGRR